MTTRNAELLAEAIAALEEAAGNEQPIRFGHEIARVVHAALLDATDPGLHEHRWRALGYDRLSDGAHVVQACSCGEARDVVVGGAT